MKMKIEQNESDKFMYLFFAVFYICMNQVSYWDIEDTYLCEMDSDAKNSLFPRPLLSFFRGCLYDFKIVKVYSCKI